MEAVVKLHNVGMTYQSPNGEIKALEDINLTVSDGEFISIVGPSGCGKSTLLSIISGLLLPTSGQVFLYGEQVKGPSKKAGYMLQRDHLFEWRTVLENVLLGVEIQKAITPETREKAEDYLKTYGLYEFRKKYPNQLSGGMRQRAALIRTLITDPHVLLLDEAFSALDYQTRLAVTDDIYQIIRKEKKTAILVTHDISEAISMADRVVVLSHRPGTVKKICEITLTCREKRTPLHCREAPEFRYFFQEIWKELDVHV
ncbi:MAG TPA: ABC transporter ATP-binding protein [Clostridia bacterium]|nr:ABC transporter ATP-binding protein [Clostridia bacterium]